jgi:preprotein translocase subunit SecE
LGVRVPPALLDTTETKAIRVNRQTKRLMQRQGGDKPRAPDRRARPAPDAGVKKEKVGPRQYLAEVRAELKKVAWPTRREVFNSTLVVLIAVVFMTSLIFGYDYLSSKFVLFLFD